MWMNTLWQIILYIKKTDKFSSYKNNVIINLINGIGNIGDKKVGAGRVLRPLAAVGQLTHL